MINRRQPNIHVKHQPVQSSTLHTAGYDAEKGDLHVVFKDGGKYVYHGVTPEQNQAFQMAGSKGQFLHQQIKGKHGFTKL